MIHTASRRPKTRRLELRRHVSKAGTIHGSSRQGARSNASPHSAAEGCIHVAAMVGSGQDTPLYHVDAVHKRSSMSNKVEAMLVL